MLQVAAKVTLAQRHFFDYCCLMAPDFYKPERTYLKELCDTLEAFEQSADDVLIINLPPRHGKSRTGSCFVEWMLGRNHSKKIMTGSYNEKLSITFSKAVRNTIQAEKADLNKIVYRDIFPDTRIKEGDASMNLWSLEDGYNNYLATSPTGTATGFGADLITIDDLIKTAEDANNALVLEKNWLWFTNTMLSRLETGGKIIIIMTRWHSQDLAGRALEELPVNGYKVKHILLKAFNEAEETMLCENVLSRVEYDRKIKTMGQDIASANYQQEPIDLKGTLYQRFETYEVQTSYKSILAYCDTADTGADYLCSIVWGEREDGKADVLDVVYTQEPMEVTEELVADQFVKYGVNKAWIERNNGGRSFARTIKSKIRGKSRTAITDFYQSKNKNARIYSNSAWVQQNIYFPTDWRRLWSEFYKAMMTYQREGKNKHDDAPDAITGVAEKANSSKGGIKVWKG